MVNVEDESIARWEKLTKNQKDEIVGLCIFTKKPVFKSHLKQNAGAFHFIPQRVHFMLGEEKLTKEVGGFFVCAEAISDPFYQRILMQISEMTLDLEVLNQEMSDFIIQKDMKAKALAQLKQELSKLNRNKADEGTKAKKKSVSEKIGKN